MMKLPYGLSNFDQIRTEGYWYVDKTKYIEMLETSPEKFLMILRSRRFGKTLFCSMLGWYYDRRHGDRFDELFRGTYIHEHPTPKRGSYLMLTFNFSGISTETLRKANEGFVKVVRGSADVFMAIYQEYFSRAERKHVLAQSEPNHILTDLFDNIRKKDPGRCVYVIIDEYDHFANNLLSQGKGMFKDLVRTDGYVRPFYEALKKGTETVVDRIFITGVLPVLLDSLTSGFNIGMNLSTNVRCNEMFGFTDEEITPILEALFPSDAETHREIIRAYYDGYRFSPRAGQTVYNSDMVLYYGVSCDPQDHYIETMIDPNVASDYRKIRAILSVGEKASEEEVLTQIVQ
ncbi:MAG: AAA family ATPase, partial [Proteobacteria bacterium]|nr:AAA family ATPase [Pseudomonadota bacterium]